METKEASSNASPAAHAARSIKVMKFGGTSVGKPHRMHEVAALVTKDNEAKIVVLSAVSGTTYSLVEIGTLLSANQKEKAKYLS